MTKFDKYFSLLSIGFIVPITMFLLSGGLSYFVIKDSIAAFMITGLILGIVVDILYLKKIASNFYSNNFLSFTIYILYMICFFCFFMGVPVFNIIPGIFAGIYIGRKSKIINLDYSKFRNSLIRTNVFISIALIIIMAASATIALLDPYTGSNIKGMLNLQCEIDTAAIVSIIILGGLSLLIIQNVASVIAGIYAYRYRLIVH